MRRVRENVVKIRPKRHDAITHALQLALELPLGLSAPVRDELADALSRYEPAQSWTYAMLNPDQLRLVLKLINKSDKPGITLRVWTAAVSHVRMNGGGEIMAGRERLAEDAETTPQEVSRALTRLTEMGALTRLRPGRYAVNPHVGWAGSLAQREAAAKSTPQLRLIETPT
jgi:hypothetical protein